MYRLPVFVLRLRRIAAPHGGRSVPRMAGSSVPRLCGPLGFPTPEVEYRGWTTRHASFKGLREDKAPAEVVLEG